MSDNPSRRKILQQVGVSGAIGILGASELPKVQAEQSEDDGGSKSEPFNLEIVNSRQSNEDLKIKIRQRDDKKVVYNKRKGIPGKGGNNLDRSKIEIEDGKHEIVVNPIGRDKKIVKDLILTQGDLESYELIHIKSHPERGIVINELIR